MLSTADEASTSMPAVESLALALISLRRSIEAAEEQVRQARSSYQRMVDGRRETIALPPWLPDGDRLSPCERRVALLLAGGKSNGEIAATLHVSVHTVKSQVKSILRKLGMQSRWQVRDAFAAGRLPEPGES
ncbi:MAG TPA: LuxR C-terminal-related transcriptional regulator [Candidatus Eisenbacteria bacterium]|nr:LuxR C-terminal-related transcriptional regulator [Candidatus Eisenbacteria bacterium]